MAEDWHQTPSDILEKVSPLDLYRWRLLRLARWDASEKRSAAYDKAHASGKAAPAMELDPDDLIDGKYFPDAEDDA